MPPSILKPCVASGHTSAAHPPREAWGTSQSKCTLAILCSSLCYSFSTLTVRCKLLCFTARLFYHYLLAFPSSPATGLTAAPSVHQVPARCIPLPSPRPGQNPFYLHGQVYLLPETPAPWGGGAPLPAPTLWSYLLSAQSHLQRPRGVSLPIPSLPWTARGVLGTPLGRAVNTLRRRP